MCITLHRGEQCIVSLCITIMLLIKTIRAILTHLACSKWAFNQCHHIPRPLRQVLSSTWQNTETVNPAYCAQHCDMWSQFKSCSTNWDRASIDLCSRDIISLFSILACTVINLNLGTGSCRGVKWTLQRLVCCQVGCTFWCVYKEKKGNGCNQLSSRWSEEAEGKTDILRFCCLQGKLVRLIDPSDRLTVEALTMNPYLAFFSVVYCVINQWFYFPKENGDMWNKDVHSLLNDYHNKKAFKVQYFHYHAEDKEWFWDDESVALSKPCFCNQVCIYSLLERQMCVSLSLIIFQDLIPHHTKYLSQQLYIFEI